MENEHSEIESETTFSYLSLNFYSYLSVILGTKFALYKYTLKESV